MNELFRLAAESMLQLYGSDAVLIHPQFSEEKIRISPLFHSRLRRENSTSRILEADANVIVSGCSTVPVPQSDRILRNGSQWTILTVHEICSGIFELELKQ
jgi:hypothetical protein